MFLLALQVMSRGMVYPSPPLLQASIKKESVARFTFSTICSLRQLGATLYEINEYFKSLRPDWTVKSGLTVYP